MTRPAGSGPEAVDAYLAGLLAADDEALAAARQESDAAGLPQIAVSAPQLVSCPKQIGPRSQAFRSDH